MFGYFGKLIKSTVFILFALSILFSQAGYSQPPIDPASEYEAEEVSPEEGLPENAEEVIPPEEPQPVSQPPGEAPLIIPQRSDVLGEPDFVEVVNPYFTVERYTLEDGRTLEANLIKGPPKPPAGFEEERQASITTTRAGMQLPNFPSFDWVFGCSAVSAGMVAAYYDRNGYPNMYTGPTNGGSYPLTDTDWDWWYDDDYDWYPNNPLVASHKGVDGRTTRGSIDDYWEYYLSYGPDPFLINGWAEHTWGDAIGDFMKTSQSQYGLGDGATRFYYYSTSPEKYTCDMMEYYGVSNFDGNYGRKLFYEARGYMVEECYSQATDNKVRHGFSLADYKAEIDAGHPVMISITGHSMVGFIRDTWDSDPDNVYTMPWGGSYYGMELRAVHIVHLGGENEPPENIEIRRDYVPSGLGIGSVVGTFSTEDPNTGGSYTYSLVPGTGSEDNESFFIDGDKLRTNEIFNNEIKDTYFIRVRSTDQGGLWIEKSFTIKISPPLKTGGIYLPLMLNSNTYPLLNGGFEMGRGVGWTTYSTNGDPLIWQASWAHKGKWIAWLGYYDDEISSISQWVAIQPAKPYLHYWYWTCQVKRKCYRTLMDGSKDNDTKGSS